MSAKIILDQSNMCIHKYMYFFSMYELLYSTMSELLNKLLFVVI